MWTKFVGVFREFGPAGAIYVLDRLLRRLDDRLGATLFVLMAQPVTDKPLLPAGLAKHLSFRELEPGSAEVKAMPVPAAVKERRFEQQAIALGVFRKDSLLGYVWFCREKYVEDEVRCTYVLADSSQSVFDFDLVVLPDARMGIGFAALWHCANQYLHGRGIRTSFSRVTRFNVASLRAHSRLGARRLGSALFLVFGRWQLLLATVSPFLSLTSSAAVKPPSFLLERR